MNQRNEKRQMKDGLRQNSRPIDVVCVFLHDELWNRARPTGRPRV
jgi:hypothetical protein